MKTSHTTPVPTGVQWKTRPERTLYNDLLNLDGKTAVVTGGAGGIGTAICRALAQAGAHVCIHYRSSEAGALALKEQLEQSGGSASAVHADLTSKADVERLFDAVRNETGRVDILINNAGVYPVSPFLEISEAEYEAMMDANVRSVMLCTQAFAKRVTEQGNGGAVVNIASIAASGVLDMHSHYCASKSAALMFTRAAARELGEHNIRVNAVSPGLIWREGLDQGWPEGVARYKQAAALNSVGRAEDVANACLFLVSDASSWITGIDLVVDGGALTDKLF